MIHRGLVSKMRFTGMRLFKNFSTVQTAGGNLFTWGLYSSGAGYKKPNDDESLMTPQQLDEFNGNVQKVSFGKYHSAVITTSGDLYTFGSGDYGALGVDNSANSHFNPRKVEFFSQKGLKVRDVACGENHTVAVTTDNQVWTWGFGGQYDIPFLNYFFSRAGALGTGLRYHRFTPGNVDGVSELGNVKQISSGDDFVFVVNDKQQVIHWGNGEDGALADGYGIGVLNPTINENFNLLKDKYNITLQRIKSANHFSVGLFSDGKLYSWGRNNEGAMGIRSNVGIKNDASAVIPTPVIDQNYQGQKVVDFDIGENTLLILTDKNQVFWSGLGIVHKPIRWSLPENQKITKIVASLNTFAALTEDGTIYSYNPFVAPFTPDASLEYGTSRVQDIFAGKKVLDIGGNYGTRYAIVSK